MTQYPLTTKSKWRTLRNDSNFRNWNARLFGFVYLNPVGQKFGTKFRNLCNVLERNVCGQPLVRIALGAVVAFFDPLPSIYAIFYLVHCMYCCSPFLARAGCLHLICWALTVRSHLLVPSLFLCCCSWSNFFMWRFVA